MGDIDPRQYVFHPDSGTVIAVDDCLLITERELTRHGGIEGLCAEDPDSQAAARRHGHRITAIRHQRGA